MNIIKVCKEDDPTIFVLNNDIESALKELHKKTKDMRRFRTTKQRNKYSNPQQRLRRKERFTTDLIN